MGTGRVTLLYCDYDGKIPANLLPWITQCCKLWRWPIEAIRYDRTRRGWHIVVGVKRKVPLPLVVAAQAIFGSDPRREMFNVMRAQEVKAMPKFWRERANVLYVSHSRGVQFRDTGIPKRRTA